MSDPHQPRTPEDLFDDYVRRLERGEAVDFEGLCAAHPAAAAELRRFEAARLLLERLLPAPLDAHVSGPDPNRGTAASAHSAGRGVAPDDDAFDAGTPAELLERLRGPRGNRYEVLNEIARGGMGSVLRVLDTDLRRKLAMKVALVDDEQGSGTGHSNSRMLSRFLEEAQVTSQLDHPGIVPVHEIGIGSDGKVFFTMRLVQGETLRDIFAHVRDDVAGWSQVRALRVIHKVCEAMSYAHEHKVIHRDLKPANIMVGRFGEVYVMDWGLARVLGREDRHDLRFAPDASQSRVDTDREAERDDPDSPLVTMDGDVVGTPAYMAPEQAKGQIEQLGPRSDVYAVGAMLYHLISGEVPYVAAGTRVSRHTLLARVIDGPPKPLHAFGRRAPAALVAICEQAMAREIGDRYASMKELADDLRRYDEGRVVSAYATGAWAETRMWVRRNRALAGSLAAAVVLLAVGVVMFVIGAEARKRNEQYANRLDAYSTWTMIEDLRRQSGHWGFVPPAGETTFAWWRRSVKDLVEGCSDRSPPARRRAGLVECRRILAELRMQPASPGASRRDEREPFPRQQELDLMRAKLVWYAAMLHLPGGSFQQIDQAAMEEATRGLGWFRLNQIAWHRVDPRTPQYGLEAEGLFYATTAIDKVETLPPEAFKDVLGGKPNALAITRDTLAWALYRNGRFLEAREAMRAAEMVRGFTDVPAIEVHIRRWEDGSAALERAALQSQVDRLTQERSDWGALRATDPSTILWHDHLTKIVVALAALEQRLRRNDTAHDPGHRPYAWPDAIAAIRVEPKYDGLEISPQVDLVPLGPDPVSNLWEFAHVPSGEPPRRTEGRLELTVATGLVFVLLPAADVRVRDGAPHEPPVPVHLDPYFLSKYEMTQAQWRRLWPERAYDPFHEGPMRPADNLCCVDCVEALEEAAGWLRLPTCAQWEHACWGADSPPDWGGKEQEALLDQAFPGGDPWSWPGPSRANARGFHGMFGGVAELCCDDPTPFSPPRRGDGLRGSELPGASTQVGVMGGSSGRRPDHWQGQVRRSERSTSYGLRPARRLLP